MRTFNNGLRMVVKIGTNVLTTGDGIDSDYIARIAGQVDELRRRGDKVMLVSSGAIGIGSKSLGYEKPVSKIELRQAFAAVGQPKLMHEYQKAFGHFHIPIAQVLLTREVLNHRDSFLHLRDAVENLLELGVVPVFNENDSVSTQEIGHQFGDNDRLSAHIASKLDARLLVLLTDIDGLYDANPRENPGANLISVVHELTPDVMSYAGGSGSAFSTGGMVTKLKAVKIAERAGCRVVLADGRIDSVLPRILGGEKIGTLFLAKEKLGSRIRWIMNTHPAASIYIDEGAEKALLHRKSLLPSGVVRIEGLFQEGDVIRINDRFKAVVSMNSRELEKVMGQHSSAIPRILGENRRDDVARPEDIVEID